MRHVERCIEFARNSVIFWDMREADRQFFGGPFPTHPEYCLPLER